MCSRKMVCFRYIVVNTLREGDKKDDDDGDDDDDDDDDSNNLSSPVPVAVRSKA